MKQLFKKCMISALILGSFASPSFAEPQALDYIVATVNNDAITAQELRQQIIKVSRQMKERGIAVPNADTMKQQVLELLIDQRLQLQQAKDVGISVSSRELDKAVINIANQNQLSLQDFRQRLTEDGYDYQAFRKDLRNEIVINKLQRGSLGSNVMVSEREIESQLQQYLDFQNKQREYQLSHILIPLSENPSTDEVSKATAKVNDVIAKLDNNASFDEIAATYSGGQDAFKGGDLGWRKAAEIPSLFAEDVPNMKVGEVKGPYRSANGFHLVKLENTKTAEQTPIQIQTKARRILITDNDDKSRSLLTKLRQQIVNGADFGELAKTYSQDSSTSALGGLLDWVKLGERSPAFDAAIGGLSDHEISQPFRDQEGWQIVQVLERKDTTEDYVRQQLADQIYNRKFQEALQNWVSQLREQALVEVKDPSLKQQNDA